MKHHLTEKRMEHLREWERSLIAQIKYAATQHSGLDNLVHAVNYNKFSARPIAGPRVAGLALNAMAATPKLSNLLQKDGGAVLQQTLAWRANATPTCRWDAVDLVIEYPWPKHLEDRDIRVTELTQNLQEDARVMRKQGNLWLAGVDQDYQTVVLSLTLERGSPHYLSGGDTGSGKTIGMLSAVGQLCACPANKIILMDLAKDGLDFEIFNGVANRVFPDTVRTIEQARIALQWAVSQIKQRKRQLGYLVLAIDEMQAVVEDELCGNLISKLVKEGRSAKITVLGATQFTRSEFVGGNDAKINFGGRLAYRTPEASSGMTVLGIKGYSPMINQLQGMGDCIIRTGCLNPTRIQTAYMTEDELLNLKQGPPLFEEWPDIEIENPDDNPKSQPFTEQQIAVATMLRSDWYIAGEPTKGYGAGVLKKRLIEAGCPLKSQNAHNRLQKYAANIFKFYQDAGYNLNEAGMIMADWKEVN